MPDEALISELETLFAEIINLGGQNERSQIVPNLTVQDANPAGQDGFVIISDDRDGDNILAKKVPSVAYADNDLVNVLFVRGGEAIAFQQGSQSPRGNLWEIVSGTSTDIFYDRGNVLVNTSTMLTGALGSPKLQVDKTSNGTAMLHRESADSGGVTFEFLKRRSGWNVVSDGDRIATISFSAADSVDAASAAQIYAEVDGAPGSNDMPGRLVLATSADGSAAPADRLRINTSELVINEPGADVNFRVEGDTETHVLFVDAGNDRLGILSSTTTNGVIQVGGTTSAGGSAAMFFDASASGIGTQYGIRIVGDASGMTGGDYIFLGIHGGTLGSFSKASIWIGNEASRPGINCGFSQTITAPTHGAIFNGDVGIGTSSPSTGLDIDANAMEFAEMTAPGAGAANTARLYAVDNGAGKTQLVVIFSSGAAQVLATQP